MADVERALRHATLLTFEEMAFAIPMDGTAPSPGPTVAAQVSFVGPFAGRLVLAVEEQMLAGLAANMLGVDEVPSPTEQADALGELANVLCGNLLPMIAGSQLVFLLDAPAPVTDVSPEPPRGRITLTLDAGTALVSFYSDRPLPSLEESST